MTLDEAIAHSIDALKNETAGNYGYDFYPDAVARAFASRGREYDRSEVEALAKRYFPFFEEAAWVLCMRGILRPGVRALGAQAVAHSGYSLTVFAAERLSTLDSNGLLLAQSSSLKGAFLRFESRFGAAFGERAVEAVAARDACLWYSCCAMAGAAAEAVLLSLSTAKRGDADEAMRVYSASQGRRKTMSYLVGSASDYHRQQMESFVGIISVWRDVASHASPTTLSTANADEALRQLLHMCQWVDREWDVLTG
jgi:hypothetical protein